MQNCEIPTQFLPKNREHVSEGQMTVGEITEGTKRGREKYSHSPWSTRLSASSDFSKSHNFLLRIIDFLIATLKIDILL